MASFTQTLSEVVGSSDGTSTQSPTPTAAHIEWPEGNPLFEVNWRAVSEALSGNGIMGKDDLFVSADSGTAMGLTVDSGSVFYNGNQYTLSTTQSLVLNGGHDTYDRWDTICYNITDGEVKVRQGEPSASPEPPDIKGDEIMLAVVYVAQTTTNVGDGDVMNWRAQSLESTSLSFDDPNFTASTVGDALNEAVSKFLEASGDSLTGTLDVSNAGLPFSLGTNNGVFGALVDMTVDANATGGNEQSFTLALDGTDFLKLYAEADGSGGIQNLSLQVFQDVSFNLNQAKDFVLENVNSDPTPGNTGRVLFNTTQNRVKVDDGTQVRRLTPQIDPNVFSADESGTVTSGNSGVMFVKGLPDTETVQIRTAALLQDDGSPVPSGVDLVIATLDNEGAGAKVATIISGDGTVQDDVTGNPITSYQNTSGAKQTIAIIIDNGNFNAGTGSDIDVIATAKGEIVQ